VHRAHAAQGPDDGVAAELECSAGRAQARGGVAAAAFLERSVALTLEPARRAERALAAAMAKFQAGAFDAALGLLVIAEARPQDELLHARADLLRGQIAFASRRGSDAPPLLLKAARRLEPLDVRLARETYLEAFSARCSLAGWPSAAACGKWPRLRGTQHRRHGPHVRPTCSWMAWPCWSRRATRRECRRSSRR
jgi:hypothetical protein